MKKKIIVSLVALSIIMPLPVEARSIGVSRPSVRVSTPRVSTPKTSVPRVSRPTSKPSSIKSGTKPMKPSTSKKSTSNKVAKSNNTKNNTTRVDSGKFTVKPKKISKTNSTITPKFYSEYSSTPRSYNGGLSIFDYYMLNSLFRNNNQVSDREIAKELEKQGYTKSETDKIIKDIKSEDKKEKEKKSINKVKMFMVIGSLTLASIVGLVFMLIFKR